MKRVGVTLLVVIAVVALLYSATLSQSSVECEACMAYGGRSHCSRVAGPTRDQAEYAAVTNACSALTSGVTRSLECQRTPPVSLVCE